MSRSSFLLLFVSSSFFAIACGGEAKPPHLASVRIHSFDVNPKEVAAKGDAVVISWKTANATQLAVVANGEEVYRAGNGNDEGSLTFQMEETTAFHLVAEGDAGRVESQVVDVKIVGQTQTLSILSFQATPNQIVRGGTATLSWKTRGAESIQIFDGSGRAVPLQGQADAEGEVDVLPEAATTYTLTARRGDERVEAHASVSIEHGLEIVFFRPKGESPAAVGSQVALEWEVAGEPTSITLSNQEGQEVEKGEASGSIGMTMGSQGAFRLTAWKGETSISKDVIVPLLVAPTIGDFKATPPFATRPEGTVRLEWSGVERATTLFLFTGTEDRNGLIVGQEGFLDVEVSVPTNFTLIASNAAGEARADASVGMVLPPAITYLRSSPSRVGAGETVTLAWSTTDATRITLETVGGPVGNVEEGLVEDASVETRITEDTEFVLRAFNGAGDFVVRRLTVIFGGPEISSFTVTPTEAAPGDLLTFDWNVRGGVALSVEGVDGCVATTPDEIESGSCTGVAGGLGPHTYTLVVANGATPTQETEATAQVHVYAPPSATLAASPSVYDGLSPVTLQWTSIHADLSLDLHELDGNGDPILPALLVVPDVDRASGSVDVEPQRNTTYRLVARNGMGAIFFADAVVTTGPPVILSFDATPPQVEAGEDVTLTWTTLLADSVSLTGIPLPMFPTEWSLPRPSFGYFDLRTLGLGTPLPLTNACGWYSETAHHDADDEGCATLSFPSNFSFPFGDEVQTSVQIYANGLLGFDSSFTGTTWDNRDFPDATRPHANIAPFWDDLIEVEVFYFFGSDATGTGLIVQWVGEIGVVNDWGFDSSVEFQVVLWSDGTFEYRYGTMSAFFQEAADGESATIGYQTPSVAHVQHFGAEGSSTGLPFAGGLSNRNWYYAPLTSFPANGSYTFKATETTTLTLEAFGNGQVSEDVEVTVSSPP